MDLISILRTLWLRRRWLAAGLGLAVVVGILVAFHVRLGAPPSLESREYTVGVASVNVLVDTPRSQVADLKPPGAEQLNARALLFANLLATAPLQASVAEAARVPAGRLLTSAPSTASPPVPARRTRGASGGSPAVAYRMKVATQPDLPIILITVEAPDARTAGRLAGGGYQALRRYLERSQAATYVPAANRPVVTRLGQPSVGEEVRGSRTGLAVGAALLVLVLTAAAILAGGQLRQSWRAAAGYDHAAAEWERLLAADDGRGVPPEAAGHTVRDR